VNLFKSGVLLLQAVTVAPAFISKLIIGFHTILLLQITVICFPSISILSCLIISIIPAGVQAINQELSHITILPMFNGLNQSTSFDADIASIILSVFICLGKGVCIINQVIFSDLLKSDIKLSKSCSVIFFSTFFKTNHIHI